MTTSAPVGFDNTLAKTTVGTGAGTGVGVGAGVGAGAGTGAINAVWETLAEEIT
jgi:hypothetical protein